MKTIRIKSAMVIMLALLSNGRLEVMAQGAPPPPPSGGHGQTGNLPPAGGNAPVGSGLLLLLGLGGAWVLKKSNNHDEE